MNFKEITNNIINLCFSHLLRTLVIRLDECACFVYL